MARSSPSYSSFSLGKYHCYTQISLSALLLLLACFYFACVPFASLSKYQQIVFCWVVSNGFFGCKCASPRGSLGIMYHADTLHLVHPPNIPLYYISLSNDIIIIAIIIIYDIALYFTIQDTYKPTARHSVPLPKALRSPLSLYPFNQNETLKSESIMPKAKWPRTTGIHFNFVRGDPKRL